MQAGKSGATCSFGTTVQFCMNKQGNVAFRYRVVLMQMTSFPWSSAQQDVL